MTALSGFSVHLETDGKQYASPIFPTERRERHLWLPAGLRAKPSAEPLPQVAERRGYPLTPARGHPQPIERALHAQRSSRHRVETRHRRPHVSMTAQLLHGTDVRACIGCHGTFSAIEGRPMVIVYFHRRGRDRACHPATARRVKAMPLFLCPTVANEV